MLWVVQICSYFPICLIHDSQLFLNLFLLGEDKRKHGLKIGNRLIQIPDKVTAKLAKLDFQEKTKKK